MWFLWYDLGNTLKRKTYYQGYAYESKAAHVYRAGHICWQEDTSERLGKRNICNMLNVRFIMWIILVCIEDVPYWDFWCPCILMNFVMLLWRALMALAFIESEVVYWRCDFSKQCLSVAEQTVKDLSSLNTLVEFGNKLCFILKWFSVGNNPG